MTSRSLRRDLLRSLIWPIAGTCLVVCLIATVSIYHEIQEVYDATMAQYAHTLADTLPNTGIEPALDGASGVMQSYERKITYRAFQNGMLIAQSTGAPGAPGPATGFADARLNGKPWRFFVLEESGTNMRIEVGERYAIRHELAFQLLSSLVLPALLFVAALLAVVWRGTTRGLARLSDVSRTVDARAADDITPIEAGSAPQEVQPLIDALNRLFVRVHESFARERQFTDNAAHELRTPLAAIKTQAQVLQRTQPLTQHGARHLDNLLEAIDRATQMTAALLAFARLQNDHAAPGRCDLGDIVSAEVRDLESAAAARGITLSCTAHGDTALLGVREGLAVLARNLIQNAVKFSPPGSTVTIDLQRQDDVVSLCVADQGPGIAAEQRDRVFERFYRINKSGSGGIGLGLAMVKWVAAQHGARIVLEDNTPTGLKARVFFKSSGPSPATGG